MSTMERFGTPGPTANRLIVRYDHSKENIKNVLITYIYYVGMHVYYCGMWLYAFMWLCLLKNDFILQFIEDIFKTPYKQMTK
jgi:hypothetical protein